jgi:hypothetical protein
MARIVAGEAEGQMKTLDDLIDLLIIAAICCAVYFGVRFFFFPTNDEEMARGGIGPAAQFKKFLTGNTPDSQKWDFRSWWGRFWNGDYQVIPAPPAPDIGQTEITSYNPPSDGQARIDYDLMLIGGNQTLPDTGGAIGRFAKLQGIS